SVVRTPTARSGEASQRMLTNPEALPGMREDPQGSPQGRAERLNGFTDISRANELRCNRWSPIHIVNARSPATAGSSSPANNVCACQAATLNNNCIGGACPRLWNVTCGFGEPNPARERSTGAGGSIVTPPAAAPAGDVCPESVPCANIHCGSMTISTVTESIVPGFRLRLVFPTLGRTTTAPVE